MNLTILASTAEIETRWSYALSAAASEAGLIRVRIETASAKGRNPKLYGQVIFVDAAMPDLLGELDRLERKGRAVVLILEEARALVTPAGLAPWSDLVNAGKIDEILLAPFRSLEVMGKLRLYEQLQLWDQVSSLNSSFSEILARLKEDLRFAERLQKSQVPARFPEIKGFQVKSRYLAGLRSGGDHFDLADAPAGNQLSIILSDSSSYGLSSAVLSVLMRVAMKLSADEVRSCEETVRRIHQEIRVTLGEKDRLSLFYGIIQRKDLRLRYINLGTSSAFYAPPGGGFSALPVQGLAITEASDKAFLASSSEAEILLQPEGRLALISDGFTESVGGTGKVVDILNRFRKQEVADCLNELIFQVKSKLADPDALPVQDCTAVLLEIDARALRSI